ncbi:MAG: hypothetical protein IPJ65_24120 [Archangiaceae bacterium]|nr:hypothetical protein [Archangiaceae bacterium]
MARIDKTLNTASLTAIEYALNADKKVMNFAEENTGRMGRAIAAMGLTAGAGTGAIQLTDSFVSQIPEAARNIAHEQGFGNIVFGSIGEIAKAGGIGVGAAMAWAFTAKIATDFTDFATKVELRETTEVDVVDHPET